MRTELTRYDAACRAIADAKSVDEVKDIRDQGIAMAAYARQAKNRELEADAIEIRMRATRRLDQMRQAQKETVGLATGTQGQLSGRTASGGLSLNPPEERPTLASQGIDKNLAHQARQLGAMSDEKFEAVVADARDAVNRAVKSVITLDSKADARADRERELAANQRALLDKNTASSTPIRNGNSKPTIRKAAATARPQTTIRRDRLTKFALGPSGTSLPKIASCFSARRRRCCRMHFASWKHGVSPTSLI